MNTENKITSSVSAGSAGANEIYVEGVLNFETVPVLMKQAAKLLKDMSEAKIDFTKVDDSNSAGLALILEMKRTMENNNKRISFTGLPEQMLIVARAYGIDEALSAI